MTDTPFLSDLKTLRSRAREHIERGALTPGYRANRESVLRVLNQALATELVCVLRYKRHYYLAKGVHAQAAKAQFLEHATDESVHADQIAERITQLGGEPNFSPDGLTSRSLSEYPSGGSNLAEMLKEDLIAERIAIDTYSEIIHFIGDSDPTTRRLLEDILKAEENHANDLANMLEWSGLS